MKSFAKISIALLFLSFFCVAQSGTSKLSCGASCVTGSFTIGGSVSPPNSNFDNIYCPNGTPTWGATDGPALLPTTCYNTAIANTPANGAVVSVTANSASALQAALNAAQCGQKITLPAGSVYSGTFTLPAINCPANNYLWIQSSGVASLPPEGARYGATYTNTYGTVTLYAPMFGPCYSGVTSLPGRPVFNCPSTPGTYTAQLITPNTNPVFQFTAGTSGVRMIGLELTRAPGLTSAVYNVIGTSDVGNLSNLIFDRIWCHGDETGDETNACLSDDAITQNLAVVDSYLNDFYCISAAGECTDAKAVGGGTNNINTTAENTIKLVNNFLEAAGENILHGGGKSFTTPLNFEIRLNLMFKPLVWNPLDPSYNGGYKGGNPVVVKNIGEWKNGGNILMEGNEHVNCWSGFTQHGDALLINPVNQPVKGVGVCPQCTIFNITVRYSIFSTVNSFGEYSLPSESLQIAAGGGFWSVHDIVADNIGYCGANSQYCESSTTEFQQISTPKATGTQALHDMTFNHLTMVYTGTTNRQSFGVSGPTIASGFNESNVTFLNSVMLTMLGIANSVGGSDPTNCANSGSGAALVTQCWSPYSFGNNCFVANGNKTWPGTNITSVASYAVLFQNFNGGYNGNYTLATNSPCHNAATDGSDIGANIAKVQSTISSGVH